MSLINFLTGVTSLFGGSSGDKSKTNTTTNTNTNTAGSLDQLSSENKSGKSTTQGVESQKSVQTGRTTGATTDTTHGVVTGATSQTGKSDTAQAQTTTMYSSDILAQLDAALNAGLTSGGNEAGTDALMGRIQQVQQLAAAPAFNVEDYVGGIAASAEVATQGDLESRINNILSATGSSETGNSMSALLGSRLRNDAAANLAGIVSQATAQGEQIRDQQQQSLSDQIGGLANDLSSHLTNLLQVASGATQATTGQTSTVDSAQQQQQQTSDTTEHGTSNTNTVQRGTTVDRSTVNVRESAKDNTAIAQQSKTNQQQVQNQDAKTSSGGNFFDNLFNALSKSSAAA